MKSALKFFKLKYSLLDKYKSWLVTLLAMVFPAFSTCYSVGWEVAKDFLIINHLFVVNSNFKSNIFIVKNTCYNYT